MAYFKFESEEGEEYGSFEVVLLAAVNELGLAPGFYWQPCFPGCLPDGELSGPFETEQQAVLDARGEEKCPKCSEEQRCPGPHTSYPERVTCDWCKGAGVVKGFATFPDRACHGCQGRGWLAMPAYPIEVSVSGLAKLLYPRVGFQQTHVNRTAVLRQFWPQQVSDDPLPRNSGEVVWEAFGFYFMMLPFGGPKFKRFHAQCPECKRWISVGHFFMHARVHERRAA